MIDRESLYKMIESGEQLPTPSELYGMFFVALVEIEEMDFKSVRELLKINNQSFYYYKNKFFPEFAKPHKETIRKQKKLLN